MEEGKMPIPYTAVKQEAPEPEFQLTVVTVCWNSLADLEPTVASVLRQKAKGSISIEHLLVDGASTDGTPEWLAGQLAAGRIERYVSEPDRGIYDAMNKGINLARGKVLAFLNAGDTYTDEDLAACVLPICRGETRSVAACTNILNFEYEQFGSPDYGKLLIGMHMPCHHQSFFAEAALYREMGGYDTKYKCAADLDVICRMYRKTGEPLILDSYVANFPMGGFSDDANNRFRNECVEFLWSNWDLAMEKQARDHDFKTMNEGMLALHCHEFRGWQERYSQCIPGTLEKLRKMCIGQSKSAHSLYARLALRFMAHCYLPPLVRGKDCSALTAKLMRFFEHACHVPESNPYKRQIWMPFSPLSSHPLFFFLRKR